ncbi:hypothetical protein [Dictyobacter alpinus]|uniref:hypothetical protein n=1 Tax=Dictyobacter alpinus TaxID=2014873 RepID=UPI000F824FB4|nr:hypothetical protein [Dictyobacter alpinus]
MTSNHFDDLTRALSTTTSRRQTFKILFASVVGGVVGLSSMQVTQAAGCAAVGSACKQNNECCTYTCDSGRCGCRQNGTKCSADSQCCTNTCDTTSGKCSCKKHGIKCTNNIECCSGTCTAGVCK